ncbi:hypothetical protein BX600DRAFT_101516 [Xylariales sp. PMI_506]|nr:hypothetical protein BX600DRAFT_101516 [Xylariales sp. PMI_506]
MVGIPRRNRCSYCRARKIKCDEAWPTCSSCQKTGRVCSGLVRSVKFVHNGHHTKYSKNAASMQDGVGEFVATESCTNSQGMPMLVEIGEKALRGGGTLLEMQVVAPPPKPRFMPPPKPRSMPLSCADQLVLKLIASITSSRGTGFDLATMMHGLQFIPQVLKGSQALLDATELYLSTWSNVRTGLPFHSLVNLRAYGKALRSLQNALADQEQQQSITTLTAITILHKAENFFATTRYPRHSSHQNGIYSLLQICGPPQRGDELAAHLAFDNFGDLFSWLILENKKNIFATRKWRDAMRSRLEDGTIKPSPRADSYRLVLEITPMPSIIHQIRALNDHAMFDDAYVDTAQRKVAIHALSCELKEMLDRFRALGFSSINSLTQRGSIREFEDPESPVGTSYDFADEDTASHLGMFSMMCIMLNRMLQHLNGMLGVAEESLEHECRLCSEDIMKCCRFMKSVKPLGAWTYIPNLGWAYEAATPFERRHIIETMADLQAYNGREPWPLQEEFILAGVRSMTGRNPIPLAAEM